MTAAGSTTTPGASAPATAVAPRTSSTPSRSPTTARGSSPCSAARRRHLLRGDPDQQSHLVPAAEPRVRPAEIAMRELVDVLAGAVLGDVDDATAHLVVAAGVLGVRHVQRHPGVALDVADLLVPVHRVDQHVRAVGVDPRLRHLRRAVGHEGRQEAGTGEAQEVEETVGEGHAAALPLTHPRAYPTASRRRSAGPGTAPRRTPRGPARRCPATPRSPAARARPPG